MDSKILEFKEVSGKGRGFKLNNVTFSLEIGFIYCIAGKNGAGKTSLLNYILSEKARYKGDILLNGESIKGNHACAMKEIGFVSEDRVFFEDRTALQNVQLLSGFYENFDKDHFMKAMDEFGVNPGRTYKAMSRGEKMKFQLAFVESFKPSLFILDEATAGMDAVFRIEFFERLQKLIAEEKCTVLMTSHNISEIEKKTDYVAVMNDGTLNQFTESMDFDFETIGEDK